MVSNNTTLPIGGGGAGGLLPRSSVGVKVDTSKDWNFPSIRDSAQSDLKQHSMIKEGEGNNNQTQVPLPLIKSKDYFVIKVYSP